MSETVIVTRDDQRYLTDSTGAKLRAWAGPDLTMDMGFWANDDRVAFEAAIRDELAYGIRCSAEEAAEVKVFIEDVREDTETDV